MSEALLTQEVGSLAKPNWRVAAVAGSEITDAHVADALVWADRLGLDRDEIDLKFRHIRDDAGCPEEQCQDWAKESARFLAARFAVRLQETAGLDIIYDGEQDRSEMYQHAADRTEGLEWRGRVRVFDNNSYRKAACTAPVGILEPWHTDEVDRLLEIGTEKLIKVPVTGAYTLADWSYDEHYGNRRDFVLDLARNVVRPNVVSLLEQGVSWIQIDEPAATTKPDEVPLFVESFNESVQGLLGQFSVHICFSDYSLLFPHVEELENCSQFSLEFANRDGAQLGVDAAHRPAYEILADLRRHNPSAGVGLGVVSIHEDALESPLLVRDRVLRAVDLLGDPAKVFPSPDCGLRTRSWEVAYEKLAITVAGTLLARQELGL